MKARPRAATPESAQEIRYLLNQGISCRRLEKFYGISRSTISNINRGESVYSYLPFKKRRRRKLVPLTNCEKEQIEELHARDYTPLQIATLLQRSKSKIIEVINELE